MVEELDSTIFIFIYGRIRQELSELLIKVCGGGDRYPIVSLGQLSDMEYDYIVICSRNYRDEMIANLASHNVPEEKIIVNYNCLALNLSHHNPEFTEKIMGPRCLTGNLVWGPKLPYRSFDAFDYVRKATLALVGEMLKRYEVKGDLAELGVLMGGFSSLMSELFPEKDIWLFDTFGEAPGRKNKSTSLQGQTEEPVEDMALKRKEKADLARMIPLSVSDVSVENVLHNMPYPDKCIVRKGYFPDTAEGIPDDIRFSLVSIDTDLYHPTLAGLRFFYPRMSRGGVILIHDYPTHEGVALAVDTFCREHNLIPIPVADHDGTVILTA